MIDIEETAAITDLSTDFSPGLVEEGKEDREDSSLLLDDDDDDEVKEIEVAPTDFVEEGSVDSSTLLGDEVEDTEVALAAAISAMHSPCIEAATDGTSRVGTSDGEADADVEAQIYSVVYDLMDDVESLIRSRREEKIVVDEEKIIAVEDAKAGDKRETKEYDDSETSEEMAPIITAAAETSTEEEMTPITPETSSTEEEKETPSVAEDIDTDEPSTAANNTVAGSDSSE